MTWALSDLRDDDSPFFIWPKRSRYLAARVAAGDTCGYCGVLLTASKEGSRAPRERILRQATLDHIRPKSRGGSNEDNNLLLCCRLCNSRKGARSPHEAGMRPFVPGAD